MAPAPMSFEVALAIVHQAALDYMFEHENDNQDEEYKEEMDGLRKAIEAVGAFIDYIEHID